MVLTFEQPPSSTIQVAEQAPRERILVVEDSPAIRDLLLAILQRTYDVETASNGREALERLADESFDLMLLDIMMPIMSGHDVLRALQGQNRLKMPVILISALGTPENVREGLELGANDYITKPVEPVNLIARVKTQLKIKRLTDDREEYIAQLERNEIMQKQLTHIASHDLRAPLSNLQMASHLLRDDLQHMAALHPILDSIDISVELMEAVVTDFLDVVRIQTRNVGMEPQPLPLDDVVLDVLTQYEIAAHNKAIEIIYDPMDHLVYADRARLLQVVSNLVSNAIKYSPSGKPVRLEVVTGDDHLCLYVIDQGDGVPEKERHLLFNEFGKTSTRPTGGEASTGLGLWIVKHLMLLMNGDVGAIFPQEGGSKFWIQIPRFPQGDV